MLRASIIQSESGVRAKREFRCDAECGCSHFVPVNLTVSCPVKCNKQSPTIAIEWTGDTGSAQDLISEQDLDRNPWRHSENPINIMTANGWLEFNAGHGAGRPRTSSWVGSEQNSAVRCLLGAGVDANEVACWHLNTSVLMLACLRRQAEVAALLLDSDAEIDFLDRLARR